MIEFNNAGYFVRKISFQKWPTKSSHRIKFLLKFVLLNLIKPFNNSLLHIKKKWIIIDCNMILKNGIVYRLTGDKNFKHFFLNFLNKHNKGTIKGISNYKMINHRRCTNNLIGNHIILIDSMNAEINKKFLKNNIYLITVDDFKLDANLVSKRIDLHYNRVLLC